MITSNMHQFYSANPEEFEELRQEMATSGQPLADWFQPQHLDPTPFSFTPTKDFVFGTGIEAAETSAAILCKMTWNFLTTTSDAPFITSDNPFCYTTIEGGQPVRAGLMTKNTQVTIPISSTIALAAEWPKGHEYVYLAVKPDWVEQVNLRVMMCSDKFVVSSAQTFPGSRQLAAMIPRPKI